MQFEVPIIRRRGVNRGDKNSLTSVIDLDNASHHCRSLAVRPSLSLLLAMHISLSLLSPSVGPHGNPMSANCQPMPDPLSATARRYVNPESLSVMILCTFLLLYVLLVLKFFPCLLFSTFQLEYFVPLCFPKIILSSFPSDVQAAPRGARLRVCIIFY